MAVVSLPPQYSGTTSSRQSSTGPDPVKPIMSERGLHPNVRKQLPPSRKLPLKDQWQVMECPFCSLQKQKRVKPLEYTSPDGRTYVRIEAVATRGMATIWDADILIWATSVLNELKSRGSNELPRTLRIPAYELLRALGRGTSGKAYRELQAALLRLQTTSVFVLARSSERLTKSGFNWIDCWKVEEDPHTGRPLGVAITLSEWIFRGILEKGSLLTLHPDYFRLSSGVERALYRIARKHAGRQPGGWRCRVELLRVKTGSESRPKEFNRILRAIVGANQLPEYEAEFVTTSSGCSAVQFRLRGEAEFASITARKQEARQRLARVEQHRRHADLVDRAMELRVRNWEARS